MCLAAHPWRRSLPQSGSIREDGERELCRTGFAVASAACGLTPRGGIAEAWIIFFRVAQGATAALLFPASVAIVVASFPLRERGKAMAIFFGISGG